MNRAERLLAMLCLVVPEALTLKEVPQAFKKEQRQGLYLLENPY